MENFGFILACIATIAALFLVERERSVRLHAQRHKFLGTRAFHRVGQVRLRLVEESESRLELAEREGGLGAIDGVGAGGERALVCGRRGV